MVNFLFLKESVILFAESEVGYESGQKETDGTFDIRKVAIDPSFHSACLHVIPFIFVSFENPQLFMPFSNTFSMEA